MDFALGDFTDRAGFVDRLADHVHDAAERCFADRHGDRRTGIGHFGAAHQTFGGVHGDGAHGVFTQVLRHFQNQTLAVVGGFKCVENRGQVAVERDVDDGADDLRYATGLFVCHLFVLA